MNHTITAISGLQVGHAQYDNIETGSASGCTVLLCGNDAVGGVSVMGAAPGTRETDLLRPGNLIQHVHAVILTGGSAFGLATADGVMQYLEQQGIGFPTAAGPVPIVPAAVLFDLQPGGKRPDAALGRQACEAASDAPVSTGRLGAGAGATVGKALPTGAMPGGLGNGWAVTNDGYHVAAMIAVNAYGDILDAQGNVIAGARKPDGTFLRAWEQPLSARTGENTTIGIVATDAPLSKEQANRLAQCAHDGLALAIRPVHTPMDGDTLFAVSKPAGEAAPISILAFHQVCVAAVNAVADAVRDAV